MSSGVGGAGGAPDRASGQHTERSGVQIGVTGAGLVMMRAAAALGWVAGLGFGLPCIYAIWYLADHGDVWTFIGFPTYGSGPFEESGIETTVPLLVLFLLVCAAELVTGWLLWHRRRAGAVLALALLPVEFAFWIGFALPLGPVMGLARAVLAVLAWPSLSRRRA